jgi:hypothetical protein
MVGRRANQLTAAALVAARLMGVALTPTEAVKQPAGFVHSRTGRATVRVETDRWRR